MRRKSFFVCAALAGAFAIALPFVPLRGHAQSPGDVLPKVQLKEMDIVSAAHELLGGENSSFIIYPGVKGKVSYERTNVAREMAVQAIALRAGADYAYHGYVSLWEIGSPNLEAIPPQKDPIDVGEVVIPAVSFNRLPVRTAIKYVFRAVGVSYSIDPEVDGTVTIDLRHQQWETVLRNVLNQVDATYRVEGGIYQIVKRDVTVGFTASAPAEPGSLDPKNLSTGESPLSAQGTEPSSIAVDNTSVFIVRGDYVLKMDKELRLIRRVKLPASIQD